MSLQGRMLEGLWDCLAILEDKRKGAQGELGLEYARMVIRLKGLIEEAEQVTDWRKVA